ncbi:zeta toxin family protein [Flavivirga rizhaonensis]|uniref:Toxin n=1 Tax=Flavivirga rizhaonensis TaxID=2559571 RepID=A0A4V6R483_9FLAO|nr:zeta toxin family protein [Flavivirga rizhaonensis]TGV03494.1 toxin [Flavivirga rizhaonensis]
MYEKRLRMFAGPNGSGKSTVYRALKGKFDIGTYVNSDDIEQDIKNYQTLDISKYGVSKEITSETFSAFIGSHSLYKKATDDGFLIDLEFKNGKITNPNSETHSYEASILADFIRNQLIENGKKLTFETVMSHKSKIETLKKSQDLGYKNYLYFISTESVEINKQRVSERVKSGGHPVPVHKIEDRYYKSLEYLLEAIKYTYRTFIFDNSGNKSKLILDIYKGGKITIREEIIPVWIDKYLLKTAHNTVS